MARGLRLFAAAVALVLAPGCSVRQLAVSALGRAMAESGTVFASDDDPQLVADALPFALKTIEALLSQDPDNPALLLSACQTFTQYSYGFVQLEADFQEEEDYRAAELQRQRALKLYLRARGYCLRGLEGDRPEIAARLAREPEDAVAELGLTHIDWLYWTAASWGAAISLGKDRPELLADLPAVRALLERALELDESYQRGALHEAFVALEARPDSMGGSRDAARRHYARAVELSGGHRAGTFVSYAENIAVAEQDRRSFEEALERALAVDADRVPEWRLTNLLAQRKARLLLRRAPELFLDEVGDDEGAPEGGR